MEGLDVDVDVSSGVTTSDDEPLSSSASSLESDAVDVGAASFMACFYI